MGSAWKEKLYQLFSHDIGIDLGTANTLVYVRGRGIVINEPSIVALNQKTGRIVAVGAEAKKMLGRTPQHITTVKPLIDGVISDYEVSEEMLSYLIGKAQEKSRRLLGPRVVIGVPSGITNVERRAVRDAARGAGAREVHIVEEPMAAAIGIRLPVFEPNASMIIDIGGGTCDIALITLGGIVRSKNVHIAGERLNRDIMAYIRDEHNMVVGEKTSEDLKIAIGSVLDRDEPVSVIVRGRDLVSGLPREITITDADIREAISHSVDQLISAIEEVLESAPPEVVADVMQRGAYLCGGGALIRGLADVLTDMLKLPVVVTDEPMTAVVRGTGIILEKFDEYKDVLISDDEGFS